MNKDNNETLKAFLNIKTNILLILGYIGIMNEICKNEDKLYSIPIDQFGEIIEHLENAIDSMYDFYTETTGYKTIDEYFKGK